MNDVFHGFVYVNPCSPVCSAVFEDYATLRSGASLEAVHPWWWKEEV